MNKKIDTQKLKSNVVTIRLTNDMHKLFNMIASEQKVTVGKYMRDAAVILAEMSTDEKEVMALIKDKDKIKAQKAMHALLIETKDSLLNSNKELFDRISARIEKLEKLVHLFLYSYFFHTPEVKETMKDQARRSAKERKKGVLQLLDKMTDEGTNPRVS